MLLQKTFTSRSHLSSKTSELLCRLRKRKEELPSYHFRNPVILTFPLGLASATTKNEPWVLVYIHIPFQPKNEADWYVSGNITECA